MMFPVSEDDLRQATEKVSRLHEDARERIRNEFTGTITGTK
jgi:hypothetical protein